MLRGRARCTLAVLAAEAPVALADAIHALASPVAVLGARTDPTLLASPPLVALAPPKRLGPHAIGAALMLL